MAPQRVERSGSGCCRLYSDGCCSLPAPLGPEGQGGFRFPPFDPLDSHNPLKTTRGKPLDPCGAYGQNITRCCKPNLRSPIFRARQKTRPLLRNPAKPPLCKGLTKVSVCPVGTRSEGAKRAEGRGPLARKAVKWFRRRRNGTVPRSGVSPCSNSNQATKG